MLSEDLLFFWRNPTSLVMPLLQVLAERPDNRLNGAEPVRQGWIHTMHCQQLHTYRLSPGLCVVHQPIYIELLLRQHPAPSPVT